LLLVGKPEDKGHTICLRFVFLTAYMELQAGRQLK